MVPTGRVPFVKFLGFGRDCWWLKSGDHHLRCLEPYKKWDKLWETTNLNWWTQDFSHQQEVFKRPTASKFSELGPGPPGPVNDGEGGSNPNKSMSTKWCLYNLTQPNPGVLFKKNRMNTSKRCVCSFPLGLRLPRVQAAFRATVGLLRATVGL